MISLLPTITQDGATSFLWGSFILSFTALLITGGIRPYFFFNYQAIYCVKATSLPTAAVHRYVDPKLDRLQLYTLTVTCVTIFYGIMLDNDKIETADPRETSVQSVMLTGMNIAVIISIPLQFFSDTTVFDFFKDKLSCCCRRGDAAVGAAAKAAKRTSVQSCQPWLPLATTRLL